MTRRFGVCYVGGRHPQYTARDLDEVTRLGFDDVVLAFSENEHRFYQERMMACVQQAHERGLTVWVDPWGVGGIFGGEAFSEQGAWQVEAQQQRRDGRSLPLRCPTSEAVRDDLRHWIGTVAKMLRAEAIFWDEPHFDLPLAESAAPGLWSCVCVRWREGFEAAYGYALPGMETAAVRQWKQDAVIALLEDVTQVAAGYGLSHRVCVQPDSGRWEGLEAKLERFAANPNLELLSTDPLSLVRRAAHREHARAFARRYCVAVDATAKPRRCGYKAFVLGAGVEPLLGVEMALMAACGGAAIAIWSDLATASMSSHVGADAERVWHVVTQAMQPYARRHLTPQRVQEDDMHALVTRLRADHRREKALVSDWPEPRGPQGHEMKARTLYTGITNGTDHNHLVGGSYAHAADELPACWGYQTVGRVIATGPDVQTLKVGDLLYMSAAPTEYVVMPEDGLLVRLPQTVEPTHAALFGMASVAMHACRTADLRLGERVLLVGQGCIGLVAAQIATVMGARVTVCEIDAQRLEVARQIGAAEVVVNVADDGWNRHIAEQTFDVVIDLAGVAGMEDQLIGAVRHRGRVVLVAGRFEVRYTFSLGQGREITMKQPSHFDQDDLDNVCRLVRRDLVHLAPLLHEIVPVTEAPRLYDRLRDAPHTLLGTVFDWQTR